MYYLSYEDGVISFLTDEIHEIGANDVPISMEEYEEFFSRQEAEEEYKLKAVLPESGGLFDYIELVEHAQVEETAEDMRSEYLELMRQMEALRAKLEALC